MSERGLETGEVTYVRERSGLWTIDICPREVWTLEKLHMSERGLDSGEVSYNREGSGL